MLLRFKPVPGRYEIQLLAAYTREWRGEHGEARGHLYPLSPSSVPNRQESLHLFLRVNGEERIYLPGKRLGLYRLIADGDIHSLSYEYDAERKCYVWRDEALAVSKEKNL